MPLVQIALYAVLGVALAISVVTDVRSRLIYNVVTFPTILLSLALRAALGGWRSEHGMLVGLVGMFAGWIIFYVMHFFGGMGGGDVKLMAGVGAALGFPVVLYALMFTALAGGLLAILVLLWEGSLIETFANMGRKLADVLRIKRIEGERPPNKYVPYGVAIAVGSVWAVWWDFQHPLFDSVSR